MYMLAFMYLAGLKDILLQDDFVPEITAAVNHQSLAVHPLLILGPTSFSF